MWALSWLVACSDVQRIGSTDADSAFTAVPASAPTLTSEPASSAPWTCEPGTDPVQVAGVTTYGDLQSALDAVPDDNEKIVVCPGHYFGPFVAFASVTLESRDGPEVTVLDGGGYGSTLSLVWGAYVTGFTITGGAAATGGGVVLEELGSGAYFKDCNIEGNVAEEGGGVWIGPNWYVLFASTSISGNTAVRGGGLYMLDGADVDLTEYSDITANVAEESGGGVYAWADNWLYGGPITENSTLSRDELQGGGGVFLRGTAELMATTITNNASFRGGGIRIDDPFLGGPFGVAMNFVVLTGNVAVDPLMGDGQGGAAYLAASAPPLGTIDSVTVNSTVVLESNTADSGGGVYVKDGPTLASIGADWGDTDVDNAPDDVATETISYVGYGSPATFTCGAGACDPPP